MSMTVYEMTHAAVMEAGYPDVAAALAAVGPNRAGDPSLGDFGWLPPIQREVLAKAAMMAHQRAGSSGWCWTDSSELSIHMRDFGSWKSESRNEIVDRGYRAWLNTNPGFAKGPLVLHNPTNRETRD